MNQGAGEKWIWLLLVQALYERLRSQKNLPYLRGYRFGTSARFRLDAARKRVSKKGGPRKAREIFPVGLIFLQDVLACPALGRRRSGDSVQGLSLSDQREFSVGRALQTVRGGC